MGAPFSGTADVGAEGELRLRDPLFGEVRGEAAFIVNPPDMKMRAELLGLPEPVNKGTISDEYDMRVKAACALQNLERVLRKGL